MIHSSDDLRRLRGSIECEGPNRHLYDFSGNIKLGGDAERWEAPCPGTCEVSFKSNTKSGCSGNVGAACDVSNPGWSHIDLAYDWHTENVINVLSISFWLSTLAKNWRNHTKLVSKTWERLGSCVGVLGSIKLMVVKLMTCHPFPTDFFKRESVNTQKL